MALTGSFTDLLMTAKRKAQLSGRPLTGRETAGIAEGYATTATDRLIRMKTLEEQKRRTDLQVEAAEEAKKAERRGTVGAFVGGGIGFALGGPVGALVGMGIGEQLGGTWLCTETKKQAGLTEDQSKTLDEFRAYAKEHHSGWLEFYVRIGPEIVKAINETEGKDFYDKLKKDMIEPVINLTGNGLEEFAFNIYRAYVVGFIIKYTPKHLGEMYVIDKIDRGLKEAA